jgi:hypothetical protein
MTSPARISTSSKPRASDFSELWTDSIGCLPANHGKGFSSMMRACGCAGYPFSFAAATETR